MDSFTVTFTGVDPELKSVFFPPIELNGDYVIGLVDFQSYNSIFNVKKPLNTLTYFKVQKITTPKGEVTIDELNRALGSKMNVIIQNKQALINTKVKLIFYKGLVPKLNQLKDTKLFIENSEDVFYYDHKSPNILEIPEGTYEVIELAREIQKHIPDFLLTADNKTMKATLHSSHVYDFTKPCLGSILL